MNSKLTRLFEHIDNIPQVPEIVKFLLNQANHPDTDFKLIAEKVEKEQAIAVRVLRLANSALYNLPKKVDSIQQALIILGLNELKKLIVVSGFIGAIKKIDGIDLDDFWIDNFRSATYAKWMADHLYLKNNDLVFTAALINSLGRILIHLDDPLVAIKINKEVRAGHNRPDSERAALGFTGQEACAELCRLWQFSDELINTVGQSAQPMSANDPSPAAIIVFIARYISESNYSDKEPDAILDAFPREAWRALGLREEAIPDKMATMLSLETGIEGLLD